MPVRRDEDGNIIDERTRVTRLTESAHRSGDDESRVSSGRRTADVARLTDAREGLATAPPSGSRDAGRYGEPTTPVRRGPPEAGRTRVYRPTRPDSGVGDDVGSAGRDKGPDDGPLADPPVGWLAVVEGPGTGRVVTLGSGVNSIGRDRTMRVSLDYGDEMISRMNHGAITYDPLGRKFYVQHGGGTNLTYVNGEPVLAPRELEPLTHVQMGNTVLRFVPLCGEGFSWDEPTERG